MTKKTAENRAYSEAEKVRKLYHLIGDRGLYVNSNHDIFSGDYEMTSVGTAYKIALAKENSIGYNSPLLFATLTSLLNHGTMLLRGAPGIGKTTGAEFAGHFFTGTSLDEILASEIQGHPQLTEEKVVAYFDIGKLLEQPSVRDVISSKFLQCPVKIIDEINRAPPDVLSIVMRVIDTGHALYGGKSLQAASGPLFATANYDDAGTFELTPPLLDRFDVAVMTTSPNPWDLDKILRRGDEKLNGGLDELLKIPEELKLNLPEIRKRINEMKKDDDVDGFTNFLYANLRFSDIASTNLVRSTKGNAWKANGDNMGDSVSRFKDSPFTYTLNELSVRAIKAIDRYAKAYSWFGGNERVNLRDVKTILPYTLWHKIEPSKKAKGEDPRHVNDRIGLVDAVVEKVESEYARVYNSKFLKHFRTAYETIESGIVNDEKASEEEIRNTVRESINQLGMADNPYALVLANNVAYLYNERMRKSNGQ